MNIFTWRALALSLFLCIVLAACGGSGAPGGSPTTGTIPTPPTPQSGTVAAESSPGIAPTIVQPVTATATAGKATGQVVTFSDRTLTLSGVSKQPGSDSTSTSVSLTIVIANTGGAAIQNQASFYQLVGAEGDAFGLQSSVSPNFYGAISPRSQRSGTIVFQVPTGALRGLRLLYRSESATETALIPLNT